MSTHVEWLGAAELYAATITEGQTWDGEDGEDGDDVVSPGNVALVIGNDDAVVIEGTPGDLLAALRRMEATLEKEVDRQAAEARERGETGPELDPGHTVVVGIELTEMPDDVIGGFRTRWFAGKSEALSMEVDAGAGFGNLGLFLTVELPDGTSRRYSGSVEEGLTTAAMVAAEHMKITA